MHSPVNNYIDTLTRRERYLEAELEKVSYLQPINPHDYYWEGRLVSIKSELTFLREQALPTARALLAEEAMKRG